MDFSRPGQPTDNAFIEAFNGRFRAECLNTHWFLTLAEAREKLEVRRRYYNEVRPHGALCLIIVGTEGGVAAKLERRRIIERTARGCADAKAKGVQFGRKPKLTPHQAREAQARIAAGETQRSIARSYNVSQATISRLAS